MNTQTASSEPSGALDCYLAVPELVRRFNSARLHDENRVFVHPVCSLGGNRFEIIDGWELAGWCSAPWPSAGGKLMAVVYEKLTPSVELGDGDYDHFEPGVYWGHGNPDEMRFAR